MVIEIPAGGSLPWPVQIPPNARLTREGSDRVAGHSCTVWQVQEQNGRRGSARVTADGVLLHARGPDGAEGIEATRVAYGPQEPARFRPPADYRTESMHMPPPR
ncbi:hypothetical protein [Caldovatus sediminis]|uniref:hypothetical protein n=1 Tax=Caldovatus sediminis TaxID=2041189 RepID=UPI0016695B29|nr:hypothetical protein [Caldovatus sediminis]